MWGSAVTVQKEHRRIGGVLVIGLTDDHSAVPNLDAAVDAVIHIIGVGIDGGHHIDTLIHIPHCLAENVFPGVDGVFRPGAAEGYTVRLRIDAEVIHP